MLERYKNVIFGAVIIAIVGGVIALLTYRPTPTVITIIPPAPTGTPAPTVTPGPIHVYVTGEVINSGKVYALPADSRIEDLITAAGGFTADADKVNINLAQALHDGDKVNVASVKDTPGPVSASSGSDSGTSSTASPKSAKASTDDPVHINTASLDDLQRLPGVGPSLAQKILDYRTQHGPFKTMNDLDNVPDVGPSKLTEWAGLIVFD